MREMGIISRIIHYKNIYLRLIFILIIIQFMIMPLSQGFIENSFQKGWSITEIISTESSGSNQWPSIDFDSNGILHVVWMDNSPIDSSGGDSDILYKFKTNDGSWSTTEVVSTESYSFSGMPSICVDHFDNIHVTWHDYTNYGSSGSDGDIFYKYKSPSGTWSTTEVVSTESTSSSSKPCIDVEDDGTVHIAWEDYSYYSSSGNDADIFYKYKSPSGTWSNTEVVSTDSYDYSIHASLRVDTVGFIHIVWHDYTNYDGCGFDNDIFYKSKSPDGYWSNTEVVSTESSSYSLYPILDVDLDRCVHVAWKEKIYNENPDDWDVLYKYKPNGDDWTTTEVVTYESSRRSDNHTLVVDHEGTVHIIWDEITEYGGSGSDNDIFYKYKNNEGYWTNAEVVSTESSMYSRWPSSVIDDNGVIHIVWGDQYVYSSTPSYICYKSKSNDQPIADFIYSPSDPHPNEFIQFTDMSYDITGYIVQWYWDFGDANFSNIQHPTHSYTTSGTYTVSLLVTNNLGGMDSVVKTINISSLEINDVNQSVFNRGFPIRRVLNNDWAAAQNFTPSVDVLTKIELYLRKFGNPEFDLSIEIRKDSLQGEIIKTVYYTPGNIDTNWQWYSIELNNVTIPSNSVYYIICLPTPDYVTTTNGYEWGYAFGNQYDGGSFWFTRDGGGLWRDLPSRYDFTFKTYGYY